MSTVTSATGSVAGLPRMAPLHRCQACCILLPSLESNRAGGLISTILWRGRVSLAIGPGAAHFTVGMSMKQSILVLGANGFIGRHVVAGLAGTGWATPILGVRKPVARAENYERRTVEATSVESVRTAMQGVTGVVNCVAGDSNTIVSSTKALF